MKKILLITMLALLGMSLAIAQEQECLPLVREGVKWVNEKVIIDHGDTTSYYYTYEFSGYDTLTNLQGVINHALYYYTGDNFDVKRDSLIAGLHEYIDSNTSRITCLRNEAYYKVYEEKRYMLPLTIYTDGGTIVLYMFGDYDGQDLTLQQFLGLQHDLQIMFPEYPQYLTEENFIEIEPIEIEEIKCSRCAYINEQGDTLAYFVQGIGFDSRDMGDLLTPFMRQPDPNADYQEYCGLSHVIKDGKIIYKGMRYNPDAVTILPGDMNGDGEITIADANGVIDIVVMGGNPSHPRVPSGSGKDPADLNGDGEVNIADVNAIIDLIVNDK